MVNEADLTMLVSNVLSENRFKHCRLCLKEIQDECMKFDDCASFDNHHFVTLGQLIYALLGNEVCEEIIGVDAVCCQCVKRILQCTKFINDCKKSTKTLHKVFDNLTESLDSIETVSKNQKLYVFVGENESQVVLIDNEDGLESSSGETIVCEPCDENFDTLKDLETHNHTTHTKTSCEICQENFASKEDLLKHCKLGHAFKCPKCSQHRSSEENLNHHIDRAHTVYVCKECGKSCSGLDKLQSHEEKHETKSNCPKCGKTYLTKCFYYKHVKLCLAGQIDEHPFRAKIEKTYQCLICAKGYSTPGGLRVHERFEHGDGKYHTCEVCSKKFTAPSYLKAHMIKHTGEKKFKCKICNRNFVSKEALLYHIRRHTGDKPYSCDICQEKFVNASGRAEHIKFKHSEPKLSCDICGRRFYTLNFLRQHKKRHEDPSSKLYSARYLTPPDKPGGNNVRSAEETTHM